jgi:hypothetical protein
MNTAMFTYNKKSNTVLVYPANGYKGYMICKELTRESNSHGQGMQVKEVLAVCCGTGGMYEKLKGLGRPIKTIVLEDASRLSEWKKEIKDRKCDVMMVSTDGVPVSHHKMRSARDARDELKMFSKSLENAVEMCPPMSCKALLVSTAFCANESKYETWNHMYKAVQKAAHKHVKGECAVLFNNMMFETLFLSRREIVEDNMLLWPVSEDAKACPLALSDYGRCCIAVMSRLLKGEKKTMSNRQKDYYLTGAEKLTPSDMTDVMNELLDIDVEYSEVDRKEWRKMIEEDHEISELQIQLMEEVFEMMKKGCLKKRTDECEKLTGRKPMSFEDWVEKHREEFEQPHHSR